MLNYFKLFYYLVFYKTNKKEIILKKWYWDTKYLKSSCSILCLLSILWDKYTLNSLFKLAIEDKVFHIEDDWNYSPMIHKYYISFCKKLWLKCIKIKLLPHFIIKRVLNKWYIFTSLREWNKPFWHIVIINDYCKDFIKIISPTYKLNTYSYLQYNMSYEEFDKRNRWFFFVIL
jgi:hypothetical protein